MSELRTLLRTLDDEEHAFLILCTLSPPFEDRHLRVLLAGLFLGCFHWIGADALCLFLLRHWLTRSAEILNVDLDALRRCASGSLSSEG